MTLAKTGHDSTNLSNNGCERTCDGEYGSVRFWVVSGLKKGGLGRTF